MKIAFISNFLCHHQLPFCMEMQKALGEGNFFYVATTPTAEEQLRLGYPEMNDVYPFVLKMYENEHQRIVAQTFIDDADVVIRGGSARWQLTKTRLKKGKLTFAYYERPYKKGFPWKRLPRILLSDFLSIHRFSNYYLLCASAYTSYDFSLTRCFINKGYKWGYFPEIRKYDDVDAAIREKKDNLGLKHSDVSILWVARLIGLKHPEAAIHVAARLRDEGDSFRMNIIGIGPLQKEIEMMIEQQNLSNCVTMLGAMSPDEVRDYMEASDIFLFTSDKNEGWGAVLNESMNSACAVVASHVVGAVPFLIKDKINGLIFKDQDWNDLYEKVLWLIQNPNERKMLGMNAYTTMTETWCAEVAVKNLLALIDSLRRGENTPIKDGPCSKAPILKENWY